MLKAAGETGVTMPGVPLSLEGSELYLKLEQVTIGM